MVEVDFRLLSKYAGFGADVKSAIDKEVIESHVFVVDDEHDKVPKDDDIVISPFSKFKNKNTLSNSKRVSHVLWDSNCEVVDLESYDALQAFEKSLDVSDLHVVSAFEYLQDVRPFLSFLRNHLIKRKGKVLVYRSDYHSRPRGYLEWSDENFESLLLSAGLEFSKRVSKNMHFFELECTPKSYSNFLDDNSLPQSFSHLLITTEHSSYRITGGIGTYIKECEHLYGDKAKTLVIDSSNEVDYEKIAANRWFAPHIFLSDARVKQIIDSNYDTLGDLVLETVESILCLYPSIISIEAQEMLHSRTIEAKRIGLLPQRITLVTTCHGASFHLAKAKKDVLELELIHVAYREKYTIEESDITIFPTEFLQKSYKDTGVKSFGPGKIIKRLPFDNSRFPEGNKLVSYKRLVYVGKTNTIKGFDLFLKSIIEFAKKYPNAASKIEDVVAIVTYVEIQEQQVKELYEEANKLLPIRIISLSRDQVFQTLAEYSKDSLALVTYTGDNHPLAVLEFLAIRHDLIVADAGGTPELIKASMRKDFIVPANPEAFAKGIKDAMSNTKARSKNIADLHNWYLKDQLRINKSYNVKTFTDESARQMGTYTQPKVRAFVVGKAGSEAAMETIACLESQTVPVKIEVVDRLDMVPTGGYVIRLAEGDLLEPRAIEYMSRHLFVNENVAAAFAYEYAPFYENPKNSGFTEFHPSSPQLANPFFQEKYSRRIIALFRAQSGLSFENLTDREIAIGLMSRGFEVRTVPQLLLVLKETELLPSDRIEFKTINSKIKSYGSLPVFDAYVLYSQLKRLDDIYYGAKLHNHMAEIFVRRDDPSVIAGGSVILGKVAELYRRYTPEALRKGVYGTLRLNYRLIKRVRRINR